MHTTETTTLTRIAAAAFALLLAGCADPYRDGGDGGPGDDGDVIGDDSGSVTPWHPVCTGEETTISGVVLAPNGKDPVPGASVFIPSALPELFPPEVKCEVCGTLGSAANLWTTTSAYDGHFVLDNVCPGKRAIVFQNGRFRRVIEIEVPPSTTLEVPVTHSRLPQKHAEQHLIDAVPKIAVATGDFDKMECVLRKMGLADGAFDLYEGAAVLTSSANRPKFATLVGNLEKMKEYNIIFINCTQNTFEDELAKPAVRQNIQEYVKAGGRLYVTDWSYDWIEQVELLAPFIDFEPGKSDDKPEAVNAGALGADGLQLEATIKDPKMAQWLGLFSGVLNNDKAHVEYFLEGWVIMHQLHEDVKVWVEAGIRSLQGDIQGTRPLTVTFNFENCGKILFTSYHTEGRDDEFGGMIPRPKEYPAYCSPAFSPQDRILEFLIFDIANCVEPIK